METKINSETAIFTLNGQEFEVKKVEAKRDSNLKPCINVASIEQKHFAIEINVNYSPNTGRPFYYFIDNEGYRFKWEQFLISEARKRGFVSGCHLSDGLKLIYMPSGRMKLLTLSKLVTDCRNPTVIYDNGKWCEVIKIQTKCKEADDAMLNKCRELIGEITNKINDKFATYVVYNKEEARVIRDVLNEILKQKP